MPSSRLKSKVFAASENVTVPSLVVSVPEAGQRFLFRAEQIVSVSVWIWIVHGKGVVRSRIVGRGRVADQCISDLA